MSSSPPPPPRPALLRLPPARHVHVQQPPSRVFLPRLFLLLFIPFAQFLVVGSVELGGNVGLSPGDFERGAALEAAGEEVGTWLDSQDFAAAARLGDADLFTSSGIQLGSQRHLFHGDLAGRAPLLARQAEGRPTWRRLRKGLRRNGVRLETDKWPGAQIPYVISSRYNRRERAILARAIQSYHDSTCVRFVPRSGQRDYIYIGKIDGCFSDVGRAGSRQEVSLDDGCVEYDTAIHELMHAVGFWHEHERWDRDQFIDIIWRNIDRDAYDQFGRVNLFESSYYGEKYDYYSIMHYDRRSFSKNGRDTMVAKQPGMTRVIGRVKNFSPADLRKINKVYQCSSRPARPLPQTARPVFATQRPYWLTTPPTPRPPPPPPSPASSGGACADKATLCWRWVPRCRSPFFEQIMRQFCAASCGFCTPTSAAKPRTAFQLHNSPAPQPFINYRIHG